MPKAKTSFDGMSETEIGFGIDGDNDLEIRLQERVEKMFIYVQLDDMKDLRKGIKDVLNGKVETFKITCSEDEDDTLTFSLSEIHMGYVNIYTEGSDYIFARFTIETVKAIRKELKKYRNMMKRDAE
ncbi:Protein of unknown function [Bacillus cereus]|nr:Protein of unknown function [Bacillus cereus]